MGDLQRAKSEYLELQSINHLEAIGIMRAIYIEQDCMLNLQNALLGKNDKAALPDYKRIRDLRNEAFGHPSERKKKGAFSRHFFDIADKGRQLIKIINWEGDGDINSAHIALPQIVDENSKITLNYLQNLKHDFIDKIKLQMKSYQTELTGLFRGANYIFEKRSAKSTTRSSLTPLITLMKIFKKRLRV